MLRTKIVHLLIGFLLCSQLLASNTGDKKVKTKVKEVTVFIEGAQLKREKKIDLEKGITNLTFTNLSPFIDAKSVQVKAEGNVTVLSVNHQQNYIDKLNKSKEVEAIEVKLKILGKQLKLEETYLSIINDELSLLKENCVISGKNNQMSMANLKEASNFYSTKLTALKLKKIERENTQSELYSEKIKLENQLKTLSGKKNNAEGEIVVRVKADTKTSPKFKLSYLVGNTGWFPSYDVRAKNINEPVQLIYKANLRQDTKVDWNNVKLKFSSSNPKISGVAPELKTYFLDYNSHPPTYNLAINSVAGRVVSAEDGLAIPGVSVVVKGATIGTATDINGRYSLTMPSNASHLVYSFVGMKSQTLAVKSSVMNVDLEAEPLAMDEVVVAGYGASKRHLKALQGRTPGISIKKKEKLKRLSNLNLTIPFQNTEKQTNVEFEVKTPYSVKSDNKNYSVDMTHYELPASFQYFCIPKIDEKAYLIANIKDWEKYKLLEGEANIFFEGTFIGKSLLDIQNASDTLQISMGSDKSVIVKREKFKDFTTRQFIGSKKEETRAWKTHIKNNKNQAIQMIILDQIPVSQLEEIEVEIQKMSGAKLNKEKGELKWEFSLEPTNRKELELKYSVTYPKSKQLIIE
ncbi:mucoidy inhibitor MuiA family protein [Ancylomarina sp. DW003]|nr:mucoidy inhibitor MuiA family protein [Ancylomarina sp. DW003]MDE5422525.1 mucoidy inhibitor MuiA family protein [Ancylomarina sp. DW003]